MRNIRETQPRVGTYVMGTGSCGKGVNAHIIGIKGTKLTLLFIFSLIIPDAPFAKNTNNGTLINRRRSFSSSIDLLIDIFGILKIRIVISFQSFSSIQGFFG